jgi:hypothetical protein
MSQQTILTSFTVYHWTNPATTADYPFLAVAEDRSAVLSLGNFGVGFDWGVPEEAAAWLEHDFAPTGESLVVDISTVHHLLDLTFACGTEFGLVTFDDELSLSGLQLSLSPPAASAEGPEYLIKGFGSYERFYRNPDQRRPVALVERAMLDVCVATFAEFAGRCATTVTALPPPRYRVVSATMPGASSSRRPN